jgi:hypothetical protein
MVFTFSASWLKGGTPYVFTYTTTATGPSGDDRKSITTLNNNIVLALVADGVLTTGKIAFTNSAQVVAFPRTPLAGALTITYTSGPAICTIVQIDVGAITTEPTSFIFNKLLGGFIYQIVFANGVYKGAGIVQSLPFEAMVDLCNQVGAHCWFNWPVYTKGQFITDVTNFFATNLSNYKFGAEMGNEVWNSAAQLYTRSEAYGCALNIPIGGLGGVYSWQGLRTAQYAALSRAAWLNAGRAASDHYVLTMSATFDVDLSTKFGNFDANCLQGQFLTNSNGVYALYSGLAATAGTSYNTAGSQPVDFSDAIGCAPYWGSPWLNGMATDLHGTVSENAPLLQASLDYTNGLVSQAFSSLVSQFSGGTTRSGGRIDATTLNVVGSRGYTTVFTKEEAQAAQYDTRRVSAGRAKLAIMHYEGGPQWGMGADVNNGVNSVNPTDITALATQIANLGWNVSAYNATHSGAGDATDVATQLITMGQAWKFDIGYKNLIKTYYYQAFKNISAANREAKPAQYGYNASQWGLFPGSYTAVNQYQNYDAIHEFNA